ncbi:MAG: hypothetical protein QW680_02810 [Pyrobaculum sp.]
MNIVFELLGERGKLQVVEDTELGYLFVVIPYEKKASPSVVRELREQTLDPWRFVEGYGFILDLSIWRQQSEVTIEEVKERIENKYKGLVDKIFEIINKAAATSSTKKKKKKKKKSKKKSKKKR